VTIDENSPSGAVPLRNLPLKMYPFVEALPLREPPLKMLFSRTVVYVNCL
jgi:hypothetical protein